jgi:L-fuconolactonase
MNRKDFLQRASLLVAASLTENTLPHGLDIPTARSLPIVDTHQHLADFKRFGKGWAHPPVEGNYGTEEYRKAAKGLNIVKAVYMEVAVAPENRDREARYAMELCEDRTSPTVGAVIAADLYREDFNEYITQYANTGCIKGIRAGFRSRESLLDTQIVERLQYLGELGLRLDFIVPPAWFPTMAKLIQRCPKTSFQADHCGNADPKAFIEYDSPTIKAAHTKEEWMTGIKAIAAQPNVMCKISGLVSRMSGLPITAENLAPVINLCLTTFGADRVMYASDWPWCLKGMTLRGWTEILKEVVRKRPFDEQKKLFHDNAINHYKLG